MTASTGTPAAYPVQLLSGYPDRTLNRLTSDLCIVAAVPILIVVLDASDSGVVWFGGGQDPAAGAGGALFLGPLLMIVIRRTYPRWWFDRNTDEQHAVHLDDDYPDVSRGLHRGAPPVTWLLAIAHLIANVLVPTTDRYLPLRLAAGER